MEFFKQTNIHWMAKAKYFFALSGTLLVIGIAACVHNGGLSYGIDFKGGVLVKVKFLQTPNVDAIRTDLAARGLGDSTIQSVHDISSSNSNELQIGLPEKGQGDEALQAGKATIIAALSQSFPAPPAGKLNFSDNSTTPSLLAEYLTGKDPLTLGVTAGDRYKQIAQQLADFRDKSRSGIISDIGDLSNSGVPAPVVASVANGFYAGPFAVRDVELLGPKWERN